MSWTQQLLQTYENMRTLDTIMTPIAHMYAKAQIEVTIDNESNFSGARIVNKEDEKTLIPVTESSAGRSSGSAPHALNDTLSYVAGDFVKYVEKDKERKTNEKKHNDYIKALEAWCSSPYASEKVDIILKYLKKNQLIEDLRKINIIHIEDGKYVAEKIGGNEYAKVLVRFRVNVNGDEPRTWEDGDLINKYTEYYLSNQKGKKEICLITGEPLTISENHPKNIVSAYGNAKLISSNDTSGFSFRGRFIDAHQANTISYAASQKMHSVLKWLVETQGKTVGSTNRRTFICWNPQGKETLSPWDNLFGEEDGVYLQSQFAYRQKLATILAGKRTDFSPEDKVIIMAMDAATTGRLSVTYYQELLASNYWDNVEYWFRTVNWQYKKFDNNKPYWTVETPPLQSIIRFAFGTEHETNGKKRVEVDDAILKEHTQRLVKCMLERHRMPDDIVQAIFRKATNVQSYSPDNRERVLSTACAVITRKRIDHGYIKGSDDNMILDKKNTDRSYLFGRLLAVYEKIEKLATDNDEKRETNALRLQAAFVNHPAQIWKILEEKTNPYLESLYPGTREKYRQLISEIVCCFEETDAMCMNKGLNENYLLGYYLQRMELKQSKNNQEDKKDE